MSEISSSVTSHNVPGGTEYDVAITVPTPAGDVHPDTPVVVADSPSMTPVPAGELSPDALVVSPGSADDTPTPPTPSGHPGDTPTTTAGEAGTATVIRPDDPDATPVPAIDLDPSTVVIPADTPKVDPGPVTAAELGDNLTNDGGEKLGAEAAGALLDALDRAGYRVVRK